MKILTLLASPRAHSLSATIARRFTETAVSLGAENQTFSLDRLSYRGCRACYACKRNSERCVVKDDLTPVLAAVEDADVLVLATPTYFGDIVASAKGFLDRCYSFLAPTYQTSGPRGRFTGKKLVFIQTQGHTDEATFGGVFPKISSFFERMGFEEAHLIRACGVGPDRTETVPDAVLAEAEAIARHLLGP